MKTEMNFKNKNILWISGRAPWPLFSGDAIYSNGLLKSVLNLGLNVEVVGVSRGEGDFGRFVSKCVLKKSWMSIFSRKPKDAYILYTDAVKKNLTYLLSQKKWDYVVVDHANSGGGIDEICKEYRGKLIYIAHNVEAITRWTVASSERFGIKKIAMLFDAWKYGRLESFLAKRANCIVCISDEDSDYFSALYNRKVVVVPPLYQSNKKEFSNFSERKIVMIGSFAWGAKSKNLELIAKIIAPVLQKAGIALEVIGEVDAELRKRLVSNGNIKFYGRVDDPSILMATARGGLVAEELGGGFKLKLLDYIYAGVPVFALNQALGGVGEEGKEFVYKADNMYALAELIVSAFDDESQLRLMANKLYELSEKKYGLDNCSENISRAFL